MKVIDLYCIYACFIQLLNLVGTRIRELKGAQRNYTATVLLTGIPNVGKSAIANSMHQIGRISAEGIRLESDKYQRYQKFKSYSL